VMLMPSNKLAHKNLADVLARRMSPDGSNMTLLQKLHAANRLMKTPIQNVTMTPTKGVRWPLAEVLKAMQADTSAPQNFDDLDADTKAAIAAEVKKFNMHAHNTEGETVAGVKGEAKALLEMAQLLESDAQSKREQAYRMDPSLKPIRAQATTQISDSVTQEVPTPAVKVKPVKARKTAASTVSV